MRGSRSRLCYYAVALTEGVECKGPPCSFLSKIPKQGLEPDKRKRFYSKSKKKRCKELYISFHNQYLVWGKV